MSLLFMTDNCADLTPEMQTACQVKIIHLTYTIDGKEYDGNTGAVLPMSQFFDKIRAGHLAATSQVTPHRFMEFWEPYLAQGMDILYLAFASTLSGTYSAAIVARETMLEKFPDAKINIVDTQCAAFEQGLLVIKASDMLKDGLSPEEIVTWVEKNRQNYHVWFMVDDLQHLKRGGRLSATRALMGTVLNIKPILFINDETRLVPIEKARGLRQGMQMMVDKLVKYGLFQETEPIGVLHADAQESAEQIKQLILEKYPQATVYIAPIGPIIGSHTGPGAMGILFYGKPRIEVPN